MNGILLGVLVGVLAVVVMLAVKRGGSSAPASTPTPATPSAPAARKSIWPWLAVPAIIALGLVIWGGKEKEKWETVARIQYVPNKPWKEIANLPPGEYRIIADGDYGLYAVNNGRVLHQRVRPDGKMLWDSKHWRISPVSNNPPFPLPVAGAPLGALIYRVDGAVPSYYSKSFVVLGGTAKVELSTNLWENRTNTPGADPNKNFSENLGGLSVDIQRKVTS